MTNPANPALSAFTVTVKFRDISYDFKITPTMDEKPIENLSPDCVADWKGAEQSHKVYSRMIDELLRHSTALSDRLAALAADGSLTVMGSKEEFTFPDTSVKHDEKVKVIWGNFVRYLDEPESGMDELGPVETDNKDASIDPKAETTMTSSVYLKLKPQEQKAARLSLFEKRCRDYSELSFDPYKPEELSCRTFLLQNLTNPHVSTKNRKKAIWLELLAWFTHVNLLQAPENEDLSEEQQLLIEAEREEMAPHVKRIREEQEALKAIKDAEPDRPDELSFNSDLETSEEDIEV